MCSCTYAEMSSSPEGFPLKVTNLVDQLASLRCPLLGLFGNEDKFPSPDQVNELEGLLKQHEKSYEFHRYDDTGHGFFAVDRAMYRVEAATDGWQRIAEFYAANLGG